MAIVQTWDAWAVDTFIYRGSDNVSALGDINFGATPDHRMTVTEISQFRDSRAPFEGGASNGDDDPLIERPGPCPATGAQICSCVDPTPVGQPTGAEINAADGYAMQYTGAIETNAAHQFSFWLSANSLAEIRINGVRELFHNGANPGAARRLDINLGAGEHKIEVRYLANQPQRALKLEFAGAGNPRQVMDFGRPQDEGQWGPQFDFPIIGIHAVMTPDGDVLSFGTNLQGQQTGERFYAIYDWETGTSEWKTHDTTTDLFCSAGIIVPETDKILISGGDARPFGRVSNGVSDVNEFDYTDASLYTSPTGAMQYARWYPTVVTLPNGEIFTIGGRDFNGRGVGFSEVYTAPDENGVGGGWRTLTDARMPVFETPRTPTQADTWWYPRTFVRPDGKLIVVETTNETVWIVDPEGAGDATQIRSGLPFDMRNSLPSVTYDDNKVLFLAFNGDLWSMDITPNMPTFERVGRIDETRIWGDFTLLANGEVLITGGSTRHNVLDGAHTISYVWSPETESVRLADAMETPRLYHSTTILLPDATVLSLGGGAPGPLVNTNGEVFSPDYLYNAAGDLAARPVITDAPVEISAGRDFELDFNVGPAQISRLTFVKHGAVTHSTNMEARFHDLDFTRNGDGTITVDNPYDAAGMTPGYYMLFAWNQAGVPSIAKIIKVRVGDGPPDYGDGGARGGGGGGGSITVGPDVITLAEGLDLDVAQRIARVSDDTSLLDNDAAADGAALSIVAVNGSAGGVGAWVDAPGGGEFRIYANGVVDFRDQDGDLSPGGSVSVNYTIRSASGAETEATLTVNAPDDGGGGGGGSIDVGADEFTLADGLDLNAPQRIARINDDTALLFNDAASDGSSLSIVAVNGAAGGVSAWVSSLTGGEFRITNMGVVDFRDRNDDLADDGSVSVSYTIRSATGLETEATVVVRLDGAAGDQPPTAVDDAFSGPDTGPIALTPLANDSDAEGAIALASVDGTPRVEGVEQNIVVADGVVTISAGGAMTFAPDINFTGVTQIDYVIRDSAGQTDQATMSVTVTDGGGGGLIAVADLFNLDVGDYPTDGWMRLASTATQTLLANDVSDVGGKRVIAANGEASLVDAGWFEADDGGWFRIFGNGALDFRDRDGDVGVGGQTSITYTMRDSSGATSQTSVVVAIGDSTLSAVDDVFVLDAADNDGGRIRLGSSSLGTTVLENDIGDGLELVAYGASAVTPGVWTPMTGGGEMRLYDNGIADFRDRAGELEAGDIAQILYTIEDDLGFTSQAIISVEIV